MIPEINLLPQYERPNPKYLIIFTMIFSLWILLVAFVAVQYILATNEKDTLETRLGTLTIERDILTTQLQELSEQQPVQQITIGDTFEYIQFLGTPTSGLIEEVQALVPKGGLLQSYSYNVGQISIQTQFNTLNQVATFISHLENSPILSNVVTNTISVGTIGKRKVYNVGFQLGINNEALIGQFGGESNE